MVNIILKIKQNFNKVSVYRRIFCIFKFIFLVINIIFVFDYTWLIDYNLVLFRRATNML